MFIKAKSQIQHNGAVYKAGDVFECSSSEGKRLIIAGAGIENVKEVKKVEKKTKSTKKRRKVKI